MLEFLTWVLLGIGLILCVLCMALIFKLVVPEMIFLLLS